MLAASGTGRSANAPLAERSGGRGLLHRRRPCATVHLRGGENSGSAHSSARADLLLALVARAEDVDVAHIFSASYWSFCLRRASVVLREAARTRTIINYRSGEARDHLQRFRSGKFVMSRVDCIAVPLDTW